MEARDRRGSEVRSLRGGRSTCATPKIRSREITLRARVRIKSPFPASTSLTTVGCLLLFGVDVKSIRDDRISGSTSTFLGCYLYLYLFLRIVVLLLSKLLSSLVRISFTLSYSSFSNTLYLRKCRQNCRPYFTGCDVSTFQ